MQEPGVYRLVTVDIDFSDEISSSIMTINEIIILRFLNSNLSHIAFNFLEGFFFGKKTVIEINKKVNSRGNYLNQLKSLMTI